MKPARQRRDLWCLLLVAALALLGAIFLGGKGPVASPGPGGEALRELSTVESPRRQEAGTSSAPVDSRPFDASSRVQFTARFVRAGDGSARPPGPDLPMEDGYLIEVVCDEGLRHPVLREGQAWHFEAARRPRALTFTCRGFHPISIEVGGRTDSLCDLGVLRFVGGVSAEILISGVPTELESRFEIGVYEPQWSNARHQSRGSGIFGKRKGPVTIPVRGGSLLESRRGLGDLAARLTDLAPMEVNTPESGKIEVNWALDPRAWVSLEVIDWPPRLNPLPTLLLRPAVTNPGRVAILPSESKEVWLVPRPDGRADAYFPGSAHLEAHLGLFDGRAVLREVVAQVTPWPRPSGAKVRLESPEVLVRAAFLQADGAPYFGPFRQSDQHPSVDIPPDHGLLLRKTTLESPQTSIWIQGNQEIKLEECVLNWVQPQSVEIRLPERTRSRRVSVKWEAALPHLRAARLGPWVDGESNDRKGWYRAPISSESVSSLGAEFAISSPGVYALWLYFRHERAEVRMRVDDPLVIGDDTKLVELRGMPSILPTDIVIQNWNELPPEARPESVMLAPLAGDVPIQPDGRAQTLSWKVGPQLLRFVMRGSERFFEAQGETQVAAGGTRTISVAFPKSDVRIEHLHVPLEFSGRLVAFSNQSAPKSETLSPSLPFGAMMVSAEDRLPIVCHGSSSDLVCVWEQFLIGQKLFFSLRAVAIADRSGLRVLAGVQGQRVQLICGPEWTDATVDVGIALPSEWGAPRWVTSARAAAGGFEIWVPSHAHDLRVRASAAQGRWIEQLVDLPVNGPILLNQNSGR